DVKEDRGIYFVFISARAFDTIEFLQQEWINGGNFVDLGSERDPIVGVHDDDPTDGQFSIPADPARKRINGVTTFIRMSGGEYLYLLAHTALRSIGAAGWPA